MKDSKLLCFFILCCCITLSGKMFGMNNGSKISKKTGWEPYKNEKDEFFNAIKLSSFRKVKLEGYNDLVVHTKYIPTTISNQNEPFLTSSYQENYFLEICQRDDLLILRLKEEKTGFDGKKISKKNAEFLFNLYIPSGYRNLEWILIGAKVTGKYNYKNKSLTECKTFSP